MKFRIAALLAASLLVSGCSDMSFSDLLNFSSHDDNAFPGDEAPAPAAVATAAPAGGPNAFCMAVAQHDATANDFDNATKQKMGQQSYAQCMALFGAN
jgi:hypothetical protein